MALAVYESATTEVHRMEIDGATQTGGLWVTGLTDPGDEVILVVASASSSGGNSYYFWAEEVTGITPDAGPPVSGLLLQVSPNPFVSSVSFRVEWDGDSQDSAPRIDVFDLQGRLVNSLAPETPAPGSATMTWDGNTIDGGSAPPGVYFARATLGTVSTTAALMLLP